MQCSNEADTEDSFRHCSQILWGENYIQYRRRKNNSNTPLGDTVFSVFALRTSFVSSCTLSLVPISLCHPMSHT
jgi:hypothetical protein